jgi:predicted amidohydrolase YtcJ
VVDRSGVLVDADVRVMDGRGARADAIAWADGVILAVGRREDVIAAAGPGAVPIGVGGATVLPGFVDAHHHPNLVALYGGQTRLGPPEVTDVPALQRALARAARDLAPGAWVVGMDWDEARLAERRAPTRDELDQAVSDRPVVAMHYSCHRLVANSRALALAGIDRGTPDPPGGHIGRGRNGHPNGLLVERGMSRVESLLRANLAARDADGFLERLARHHDAMLAVGITAVVDATVPGEMRALYQEAERRDLLRVTTVMLPVSTSGYFEPPWDVLESPRAECGSGVLRTGPVKLVFDGAPACAMCLGWLQLAGATLRTFARMIAHRSLDPMRTMMSAEPRIGREIRTGITIYDREEARAIVRAATERGFAVATHALGNDAIDVALGAYQAAGSALARGGTPRIEHAMYLDRERIGRIADLGAVVVAQPHFLSIPSFASAPSIPGLRNTALRWLLDGGVRVAGSSDFPVAGFTPLDGVRSAVTRRTSRGEVFEADQCITLDEALAMYTRESARAAGLDDAGTLEIGKRADLVVLDGPLRMESLARARVRATVARGVVAHGAAAAC